MKVIKRVLNKEFENIELYFLADLHLADPLCNMKIFDKWKNEVLEQPNRFVIINGDCLDNATRASIGDSYRAKMPPNEAIDLLVEKLEPLKDRILSITEGNHEMRTYKSDGILIMERVAHELKLKDIYSDGAILLFLSVGKNRGRENCPTVYSIYSKHGAGGGKKEGSKLNALAEMAETIDVDAYIISHTHLPATYKTNYFRSDYRHKMGIEVTHTFINTNAFLDFGGYGENQGFKPASKDYPKAILSGYEKDIKVII